LGGDVPWLKEKRGGGNEFIIEGKVGPEMGRGVKEWGGE
jgi:hypothetical protein